MEISSVRQPLFHVGEERYQMLELNSRLESYLSRVKLLEEENHLLREEINALRRRQDSGQQRQAQEEALTLARRDLQAAWREKDRVEMEVSTLLEEIEALKTQGQKEKAAQSEAKRRLTDSRKQLEDERRMQIWLKEQAALLEKEVLAQMQIHQEDMKVLRSSSAFSKPLQTAPQHTQTLSLHGLAEEFNQRAAQAWQEAAVKYHTQTEKLEESLNQAVTHMAQLKQEKRQSQLQIQDVVKELDSTRAKRELLERNLTQQKNRQNRELQNLQAHVETLMAEKVDLGQQIDELVVDRRNLLQMKMSLGLEVATYRALLDSENLRVKNHSTSKKNTRTAPILEALSKSPGPYPCSQTIASSHHFRTPLTATSRFISQSGAKLMTLSSTQSVKPSAPQEAAKRIGTSESGVDKSINKEVVNLEESVSLASPRTDTSSVDLFSLEDAKEALVSDALLSPAVDDIAIEDESISDYRAHGVQDNEVIIVESCTQDGQVVADSKKTALISFQAEQSSLLHTTETDVSPNVHKENVNGSEDGEKEETEMSTETAQISHAPMFAWKEDNTMVPEEKDVVSELGLDSENFSENDTKEFGIDTAVTDTAEHKMIDETMHELTTEASALSGYELGEIKLTSPLSPEVPFSYSEKKHDILTLGNVQDNVGNFPEEESLKSAVEAESVAIETLEEQEKSKESEENIEMLHSENEVQDVQDSDSEAQKDEQETEPEMEERNLEEREEEEMCGGGEEDAIVSYETLSNTAILFTAQNTSASEVDQCKNLENNEKTEQLVMKANNKDHLLVDDHKEEEKSDDDESLNISASWRTDPGEVDSYAQENTLADTRPLIQYKSDEETYGSTHAGLTETSDSEEERDRHEGLSFLNQNTSKRFDTMEDLSEEPEMENADDTVTDRSPQTIIEGYKFIPLNVDETACEEPVQSVGEWLLQSESGDVGKCGNTVTDGNLVNYTESDFGNKNEEGSHGAQEMEEEKQHVLLPEKLEENELLPGWSESFPSESREMNENQTSQKEESESDEGEIAFRNDYKENCDMESIKLKGEERYFEDLITDTSVPETSQNEEVKEEPCEDLPKETGNCEMLPFETTFAKEQVSLKEEEDEQSNLSMLTHADFIDNLSLQSGQNSQPESQINTVNSDLEESNSSEDESPNASQCFQPSHVEMPVEQQFWDNTATTDNHSVDFPGFQSILESDSYEHHKTPQTAESDNSVDEDQQDLLENRNSSMNENSLLPQAQDQEEVMDVSHSILSNLEDLGEMTVEKEKTIDTMDDFQGNNVNEECQSKEKDDSHSFFSSSIKEEFWSTTKFEMAATYDSEVETKTEMNLYDTIPPNQSTAFAEDWGSLGNLPPANGTSEKETDNSTAHSDKEEHEENEGHGLMKQRIPQVKQLQSREVKHGEVKVVQSDDSNDEGDSWSSGEE